MYWSVELGELETDEPSCIVHHNGETLLGLPVNRTTCRFIVIFSSDESSGIYGTTARGTSGESHSVFNLTVVISYEGDLLAFYIFHPPHVRTQKLSLFEIVNLYLCIKIEIFILTHAIL